MHTTTTMRTRLENLRERYRSIEAITARLGLNPVQETLDDALTQRAHLLQGMAEDQAAQVVREGSTQAESGLQALIGEIRGTIAAICSMDLRIEQSLREKMAATRDELRDLYGTSRVARAYSAQVWQ